MTIPLILLALLISLASGGLLLRKLLGRQGCPSPFLFFFMALGLGLGISAYLGYLSFLLAGQMNRPLLIILHILTIGILIAGQAKELRSWPSELSSLRPALREEAPFFLILCLLSIPLFFYAWFFPYGGWDAWSCWNFKAKFMLLGKENWTNMFDPILWRSSPHYPLLLPLMVVWTWALQGIPSNEGPMAIAILFGILIAGLLWTSVRVLTRSRWAIIAPALLLTLPYFNLQAISQYSDLKLGFYLFGAMVGLVLAKRELNNGWAALAGLFLGFMSFTKPEGTIAALLAIFIGTFYLQDKQRLPPLHPASPVRWFFAAVVLGLVPTLLFLFSNSPGNQTFINGLASSEKPSDMLRLRIIVTYLAAELISKKWHSLWILLLGGGLLAGRRLFTRGTWHIPVFLFFYMGIVLAYYWINTYFEITWWLQVSLRRILYSLMAIVIFWVCAGLLGRDERTGITKDVRS